MKIKPGRSLLLSLLLLASFLCLTRPVAAKQRWAVIGEDRNTRYSIDLSSFKKEQGLVWFWLHAVSIRPVPSGDPQEALVYSSMDCRNRKARVRKLAIYNTERKPVFVISPGELARANPVPNRDLILRYVCSR